MNIYVQIMSIYGIMFSVSMLVALIIWALAKIMVVFPALSFKSVLSDLRHIFILDKKERQQFLKEFRESTIEGSEDLINYHHEHA